MIDALLPYITPQNAVAFEALCVAALLLGAGRALLTLIGE